MSLNGEKLESFFILLGVDKAIFIRHDHLRRFTSSSIYECRVDKEQLTAVELVIWRTHKLHELVKAYMFDIAKGVRVVKFLEYFLGHFGFHLSRMIGSIAVYARACAILLFFT